jgi:hypothetical protein
MSGGGHRLTFASERFVGLVADDIAQVSDSAAELRKRCGQGLNAKPAMVAAPPTSGLATQPPTRCWTRRWTRSAPDIRIGANGADDSRPYH